MLHGDTRRSKATPLKYLRSWLNQYAPSKHLKKWVVLDQGGELFGNPEVHSLFREFGYSVLPTGGYASWQNGPVERAHRTISDSIKALLIGAGLDSRFWPYAFYHSIRLRNAIPGAGQSSSPLFMATGRKDNFKNLRVFGCRVLVPRLGKHVPRFSQNKVPLKGVFLGYIPFTDKLIQWYDEKTGKVKITTHATFDEGFSDLPLEDLPLGASQVVRLNHGMRTDPDPAPISCKDLDFFVCPFAEPKVISIPIPSDTKDPTFGLTLVDDSYLHRTFVSKVKERSPL